MIHSVFNISSMLHIFCGICNFLLKYLKSYFINMNLWWHISICTSEILLMKHTLTVDLIFIFSWLLSGAFDKCFIIIVLFTINMPSNILGFLPLSNIFELLIVEEIWTFNICHLYSIVKQNILYRIHNATLVYKLSLNNWYCFVVIIVNVSLVFLITAF